MAADNVRHKMPCPYSFFRARAETHNENIVVTNDEELNQDCPFWLPDYLKSRRIVSPPIDRSELVSAGMFQPSIARNGRVGV